MYQHFKQRTKIPNRVNQFSFKKQYENQEQNYGTNSNSHNKFKQNSTMYATKGNNRHLGSQAKSYQKNSQKKSGDEKKDINRYIRQYEYEYNGNVGGFSGHKKQKQSTQNSALKQWRTHQQPQPQHKHSHQNQHQHQHPINRKSHSMNKSYDYPLQQQQQRLPQNKDLFIYSPQFNSFTHQYERYSQGKIVKQLLQQNRFLKLDLSTKNQSIILLEQELQTINRQFKYKLTYFMGVSDKKQLEIQELVQKNKVYEEYLNHFKQAQIQRNLEFEQLLRQNMELSSRIVQVRQASIDKKQFAVILKQVEKSAKNNQTQIPNQVIIGLLQKQITQKQKLEELVINLWKMKCKIQQRSTSGLTSIKSEKIGINSPQKSKQIPLNQAEIFQLQNLKALWSWIKKIGHQYSKLKKQFQLNPLV